MVKELLSKNENVVKETWPVCSKCNTNPVERCSRRSMPYSHGLCISCRKHQKRLEVEHEIETALVSENRAFPKKLIENYPWLKHTIENIVRDYEQYIVNMPEMETGYILRELYSGFQHSLWIAKRDRIKALGGTEYTESFYDATNPYEIIRKTLVDMQEFVQKICEEYHDLCKKYDKYINWLNDDKDCDFAMTKRLILNEMVQTIPVEIQDQAIKALRGVIDANIMIKTSGPLQEAIGN